MSGELRPRLCMLEKGSDGYGFHLHGEKNKAGQFIRLVEPGSPAETSGLKPGDKLVFVNGDSVDGESHQQVVSRIRGVTGALELIVVDAETAEYLRKHNLECRKEFVREGVLTSEDRLAPAAQDRNGTDRDSSPVPAFVSASVPAPTSVPASVPVPAPTSVPASAPVSVPVPAPFSASVPAPAFVLVPAPASIPASNGDMGLDTLSLSSKVNLNHTHVLISVLSCM
ncbi:Na(+)/H(+) exchange regulatory cofactor NHE-RF1a [Tachysurus ichikawai]